MLNNVILIVFIFIFTMSCDNQRKKTLYETPRPTISVGENKELAEFYYKNSNDIKEKLFLDVTDSTDYKIDSSIFFLKNPNVKFLKFYKLKKSDTNIYLFHHYKTGKIDTIYNKDIAITYLDSIKYLINKTEQ